MNVRKIDIDTLCGDQPTWGRVTVNINGRDVTVSLDADQIEQVVSLSRTLARYALTDIAEAA